MHFKQLFTLLILTPIFNNQRPYFNLFQQHPDYSIMRVFGCLVFLIDPTANISLILENEDVFLFVTFLITRVVSVYTHQERYIYLIMLCLMNTLSFISLVLISLLFKILVQLHLSQQLLLDIL